MKTNKKVKVIKLGSAKRDKDGVLINPTPDELLADIEENMKGPKRIVDPTKSREERMKELGWL